MKSELSGAPPPAPNSLLLRVACVVGLCVTGDSLLYTLLPLEAENLGFSAYQLGLLLSVNRLIRLVSNSGTVLAFERTGTRSPFLIATLASLLTMISYGFGTGFLVFLLARIFWGIAWSGLRLGGYQAVWTGPEGGRGRLSGLLWGVIRMGSALSVVCGGYLRDRFGYLSAVSAISLVTALAIPVALSIRWPQRLQKLQKSTFSPGELGQAAVGDSRGQILLAVSLLMGFLEGVLISTAALFVAARLQAASETGSLLTSTATIAGLLLATRWTSDMVFGPAIGVFSDRVGQSRTLTLLSAVLLACLTAATGGSRHSFSLAGFLHRIRGQLGILCHHERGCHGGGRQEQPPPPLPGHLCHRQRCRYCGWPPPGLPSERLYRFWFSLCGDQRYPVPGGTGLSPIGFSNQADGSHY